MHHTEYPCSKDWKVKRDPVGSLRSKEPSSQGEGGQARMDFPGNLCEVSPYRAALAIRFAVGAQPAPCLLLPRGVQMSIQFQMILPYIIKNDLSFWPSDWHGLTYGGT